VMIRPEQIQLARGPDVALNGGVAGKVIDYAYYGPDTVLRLSLDSAPGLIVRVRTFDHAIPISGEAVELAVIGPVVVFSPTAPASTT
jgi:hypothetical protein